VAYSPVADASAGAEFVDDVVVDGVVADDEVDGAVVAAAGEVPGDAEALTRDVARRPRPTAAAADAVHAAPSAMCRFMGQTLGRARLSPPQDQLKSWEALDRAPATGWARPARLGDDVRRRRGRAGA